VIDQASRPVRTLKIDPFDRASEAVDNTPYTGVLEDSEPVHKRVKNKGLYPCPCMYIGGSWQVVDDGLLLGKCSLDDTQCLLCRLYTPL
jgi:hypothetical protein